MGFPGIRKTLRLRVLTLSIPTKLSWFDYLYAAIGFGFAISYLVNLLKLSR